MTNSRPTSDTLRFIRCETANENYALDMGWVRSIQRVDRLHPAAGDGETDDAAPVGWLSGSEGEIPVYGLAGRLGRHDGRIDRQQRIIVLHSSYGGPAVGGQARPWALLVDTVSQVIAIPAGRLAPLPPVVVKAGATLFLGVIVLPAGLILLLAPERMHPLAPHAASAPQFAAWHRRLAAARAPRGVGAAERRARIGRNQIIVFSTGDAVPGERPLVYGLSVSQVPEVLDPLPILPVPAAPDHVLGLVNWRGRPVPVLDLDSRLGLAPPAAAPSDGRARLLIARDGGLLGGFLVRPGALSLRLPVPHQPCSRSLAIDPALTRGLVELHGETLVIPDVRAILKE